MAGGLPNNLDPATLLGATDQSQQQQPSQTLDLPQVVRRSPPTPLPDPEPPLIPSSIPFMPSPSMMNALGFQESGNNPNAKGKAGEIGRFQMLPSTAKRLGYTPEQMKDPRIQYQATEDYLGELLNRYHGNEFLALVAYNSGPGRVDKGQLLPQSVKYATSIINRMRDSGGIPEMLTQTGTPDTGGGGGPPPEGALSRMGSALSGALEGTAYAGETPAPIDFSTFPRTGSPTGSEAGGAGAATGPPSVPGYGVAGFNPTTNTFTLGANPVAGSPGGPGSSLLSAPAETTRSVGINVPGMHMTTTTKTDKPPQAEIQQMHGAIYALAATMKALQLWDRVIQPRVDRGDFSGSVMTPSGFQAWLDPYESQHTHDFQALGFGDQPGDPDLNDLYDKIGPIQAAQLKAQTGGRVGVGIAEFLSPHLPKIPQDNPWRIHQKLLDLKENLPTIIQTYMALQGRPGITEDQVNDAIQSQIGGMDWPGTARKGKASATKPSAPEPVIMPTPAAATTPAAGGVRPPGIPADAVRLSTGTWYSPSEDKKY